MRRVVRGARSDITHITFAATRTHNAPGTIGLWSYRLLFGSQFDDEYIAFLPQQTYASIIEAVANLVPADTILAQACVPQENFSRDSRPPIVVDHQLPLAWFKNRSTGETIATLASWGMHPEGDRKSTRLNSSHW